MAAFSSSYQYYPFLFDSALILSNNNINTTTSPAFLHHNHHETSSFDNNNNNVTNNINNHLQDQTVSVSCVDQSSKVSIISDNEPSVSKNLSPQSSMVVDKLETGDEQVTQRVMTPMGRKRRIRHGSSLSNPQSKDATEEKSKKKRKSNNGVDGVKEEEEEKGKKAEKKKKKGSEEPPTGYIHVRARRGQATDSHSLAERVRREKISERMKMLQRLVPGCDKVTGKALMLDEIINYVQSLQNQVEFLSLKLASVNPIFYDLASDIDTFLVRPEASTQKMNSSIISPTPAISVPPHCSTTFADTITTTMTTTAPTTATTIFPQTNDYVLDSSASIFLQGQRSNSVFSEDNESHFWVAEDQRQKLLHSYGFINNNLCSFH